MNPHIIFENKHVVIIDKPIGVIVHPDGREQGETIAHWMKEKYNVHGVGDKEREGVVHRLDRDTSGVLVLAKDAPTFFSLKQQFHDHTVRKVYKAIVEGHIRHETGMISLPLARAKSDFRKKTIVDYFSSDMRGEEKEAITRYKVLAKSIGSDGAHYSYIECYPITGRTHQIRAHLRGIRHPIIGDDLYGSLKGKSKAPRSMLHAFSITLSIKDDNGKEAVTTYTAPIPPDMEETLKTLNLKAL